MQTSKYNKFRKLASKLTLNLANIANCNNSITEVCWRMPRISLTSEISVLRLVWTVRSVQLAFYIKILYSIGLFGINILYSPFYIHTSYGCYFSQTCNTVKCHSEVTHSIWAASVRAFPICTFMCDSDDPWQVG